MLFDRFLSRLMRPLPATTRLMTIKDLRLFRRDPMQWLQILIFVGFLLFYFVNIRPFTYDISSAGWVNMISFLNLAVVGLTLSTFTTRFIFPRSASKAADSGFSANSACDARRFSGENSCSPAPEPSSPVRAWFC